MLILQALLLWLVVSTLMMGGAMLFHRYFPHESPWWGFIVPPLAVVVLFNFIEHLVALPVLLIFLPVLLGGTVWLVVAHGFYQRPLILPSVVFLLSFAFTFAVRCLHPDIMFTSDGISDLNMVNNFSQGQSLPPPDCWMPPYRFEWYYDLQHYAASIVERLLQVKIGVAYNVSHALLSALICVAGAAAAFRLSGEKIWVTLAVPFLIESAATGSSAYIALFCHNPSLWFSSDLSGGMTAPPPDGNILWKWLDADPRRYPLRLQVPGFWTWRDEYHANASGHLLTLLSIFTLAELAHARRTMWPWIIAVMIPLLAATASAWALPITVLLCWGVLPVAVICGRRPQDVGETILFLVGALALLWPAFYNATSSPEFPSIRWSIPYEEKAPWFEFIVQWWPILVLLICGCFCFRTLSFSVRWVLFIVPVMLIGIEQVDIETRYNMIEKMWGYTWGAGLIALFPIIATRAGLAFRMVTILLLTSAFVSLGMFVRDALGPNWDGSAFQLEGNQYLRGDDQKRQMLQTLAQVKHATFLSGKTAWCYNEAPTLAVFTGNRSYIAWTTFESLTDYKTEVRYRMKLNDDFYAGTLTDRLNFLLTNKIAGVLIWPDDNLSNDFIDRLRTELGASYDYVDCKGNGEKNAGVFLRRPLPGN